MPLNTVRSLKLYAAVMAKNTNDDDDDEEDTPTPAPGEPGHDPIQHGPKL